jgi:hypothetical protein
VIALVEQQIERPLDGGKPVKEFGWHSRIEQML